MRKGHSYLIQMFAFFLLLGMAVESGCGLKEVDPMMIGTWVEDNGFVTVRESLGMMKFQFTSDSAAVSLTIDDKMAVSGTVGNAIIEGGSVKPSKDMLPPNITGLAYVIECQLVGKIFPEDPIETKKVEFWITYPVTDNNHFTTELRYTEGGAQFPMSSFTLSRVNSPKSLN